MVMHFLAEITSVCLLTCKELLFTIMQCKMTEGPRQKPHRKPQIASFGFAVFE
jgi:hypothetical protein